MFYNVMKTKNIIEIKDKDTKFDRKILLEKNDSSLSVVAIKKGEIIDTHTSISDAAVCVVEGEIELCFDTERFTVEKGEMLLFKKDEPHKVLANKDSKFLLIKI